MPTRNQLTKIAESVGQLVRSNARFAAGVALGVSAMFAGYAVSAVSSSSGSTLVNANSTLISQQTSVVAESIKAAAEDCNENGIGKAIQDALKIHQTIAAAPVNTESLFDPNNDCFSGLSQIYDLSFAIPSLDSIVGAASDAVMQYAQKTVCSAVNQASGLATGAINDAINQVNQMGAGLSQIDPSLGSGYSSSSGGSYTVGTNPFNAAQTDFGGTAGTTSSGNGGGSMDGANAQINGFNQQIANVQAQIGPAQYQLQQAQRDLSNCQSQGYNNCTSYQFTVDNAQGTLNSLNTQLTSLQGQLSNVSPSSYRTQSASVTRAPTPARQPAASDSSSWIQSIGSLFN